MSVSNRSAPRAHPQRDSGWLVGVDLGGTKTEVILMDQHSQTWFRHRRPTPAGDYGATLSLIAELVADAERQAGVSGLPVGVGIPGSVSRLTGLVKNGNSTWLNGQPLADDLRALLSRPVAVTNDANCLALSEATDGAGRGFAVVFSAILGTGCGAGVSVDGRVLTGPNGVAGEWGHNPLPWTPESALRERPCFCGRFGCTETFLSGPGLAESYRLIHGEVCDSRAIVSAATDGDARAQATMATYVDHLARGLAGVINLLDPDVIVLGGGLSNIPSVVRAVPGQLAQYVFGGECETPVVVATHGDSSGVRGAAWLGATS